MRITIERTEKPRKATSKQIVPRKKTNKRRNKSKKVILQRIDSFSKELIYINLILLIIAFGWSMYLCTKNTLDPQLLFSEVADCWKKTFPIYLCKSGVENISKAITNKMNYRGGIDDECNDGARDNGFSRTDEDNRDT